MINPLCLLRLMLVGFVVNNRVAIVTGAEFEGDLVIGRNDADFDEKVGKVHHRIQKKRFDVMWDKRRALLEELRKDNISVSLDSEDTNRELMKVTKRKVQPKDNRMSPKFFDDLPLPTRQSEEIDNPELSQDIKKLYHSIESIEKKVTKDDEMMDMIDLSKRHKIDLDMVQPGKAAFTIEPFHSGLASEEIRRKLESVEAGDIVAPESQRTGESIDDQHDKMPIFRSDYLDSSIIREGKRSEIEPDDPSIYDIDQPTEDPIEKYGKIDLDLVKLFSLEKNESLKQVFLNNSRKMKKQKQAFLRNNVNTTLINFDRFKLPRSEESMMEKHDIRLYDQDEPKTKYPIDLNSAQQKEAIFAEYFTGGSSSDDSHMNTNEFYDELVKVDFDITRNKKLLAVFQMYKFKNATIEKKIEEKMKAEERMKLEEKVKAEEKMKTKRGTKQKRITKSHIERLIEDVEKMSTRNRRMEFQVTKKERNEGMKTASEELRLELEQINMGKEKVVGKRGKTKKSGPNKTKVRKPLTKRTNSTNKYYASDDYKPFQRIIDKFTLSNMSLRSTLKPTVPIPDSAQYFTLAHYDLKDFGINMNDEAGNITQVQSRIEYEDDMSEETKKQMKNEQEDHFGNFGRERKKRFARNIYSENKTTAEFNTYITHNPINETYSEKIRQRGIKGTNDKVLGNKVISKFNTKNTTNEIHDRKRHEINATAKFEETDPSWYEHYTIDTNEVDFENKENTNRHNIQIDQSRIMYEDELSEESKKEIRADENKQNEEMKKGNGQKEDIHKIFELWSQRMSNKTRNNKTDENYQKEEIEKINHQDKLFEFFNHSINKTKSIQDKVINKRRKRDIRTDEDILKKYTKKMGNRVLQKRFQQAKKTGNLGYMDDQEAKAYHANNETTTFDDDGGGVSVLSVQYNEEVLRNLMGLSGENNQNDTQHLENNQNSGFHGVSSNETLSRGFELEVENVPFTTMRIQKQTTCRGSTKRKPKANPHNDNQSDDLYKDMKDMAQNNWDPANMGMGGDSYGSEHTDKSFYDNYKDILRTTPLLSEEMIDLAKANDSEIDSFIRRKEEATRRANLLRDLIVTTHTSPASVTYKTRRTFNRRILVNCTGSVVNHRFNLLIPPRLKRTQKKIYVTEYPRYNIYWYYSMWPNMAKLLDKHTARKRNSTGRRSTKYPKTIPTIYITKKKTTQLIDRILNNLYNSTKYAKTKFYKPSFNSDIEFKNEDTKTTIDESREDACNETSPKKSKKTRNRKSRLQYVKTKVEILENNDLIDNRNWGMAVYGSNFTRSLVLRKLLRTSPSTEWHISNVPTKKNIAKEKAKQERLYYRYYGLSTHTPLPWVEENMKRMREKEAQRAQEDNDYQGQYDIKEYADYLGMDPTYFFDENKETVPFEFEKLPDYAENIDLFNNHTDFTYTEYDVPTDPTFTFDPVYHDNVEELEVMRKPTRTTFDPTAMNERNYKRFFTWTTTRKKDRTTTEMIIWTERTFRAKVFDAGPTEYVPVYTCHQCPARFLNNEDTDGQALLMRHFLKHQNLEELYYPIGWRFEKSNRTRWYNARVRRYFMRLLREQDYGLSAMK
uniref:Uncharacterized protein n=1 Tax=Cacopsylla melanoneura TaxID=428564 RepID=A0A8D8Z600_9HEMI